MHAFNKLTPLLPLFHFALALPHEKRTSHEFDITSLSGKFPSTGPYGTGPIDSSLSITITYPNPSVSGSNLSTTCSYAWPASVNPGPTDWTVCADPSVQWRLPADGWTSSRNYRVEIYQTLSTDGWVVMVTFMVLSQHGYRLLTVVTCSTGLDATHYLTVNPGVSTDPNAYLSCLVMGKFNPDLCQLNGPLSARPGPVVMYASEESARPN
jgi:hypothetical protein